MKCIACNKTLAEHELKHKNRDGSFSDMCLYCRSESFKQYNLNDMYNGQGDIVGEMLTRAMQSDQ